MVKLTALYIGILNEVILSLFQIFLSYIYEVKNTNLDLLYIILKLFKFQKDLRDLDISPSIL